MIQSIVQDIRYGARLLWRSPWFTAVGVVSLAVGLGSGVGLFTVMNAVLFRPLPGRDTASVHRIYTSDFDSGRYGSSSLPDFQSFTAAPDLFAAACATTNARATLVDGATAHVAAGAVVNGGCFETFGVRPHIGRLLNRSDDAPAQGSSGVVISHSLWRRAFGADPAVVGRSITLSGGQAVVVGVAERGFAGVSLDSGTDFWAPVAFAPVLLSPQTLTSRGDRRFAVYVRLREGATASRAAEQLSAVAARLRDADPGMWTETSGVTRTVTVVRELDSRFADAAGVAEAMAAGTIGAIALVVGLACVNLATMIMARGAGRTRELNVRLALGASRTRLLRQLATESLLISIAGIAVALFLVALALRVGDAFLPTEVPAFSVALDWRVAGFAVLVALAAPILFGLAPGAHALRLAIAEGIKGQPPLMRRRYLRFGQRELLLGVQLVVSFAFLVAAAVFLRSLGPMQSAQNLAATRISTVDIDLNTAARSGEETRALAGRLLEIAEQLPGVDAATAAAVVPMTGSYLTVGARLDDRPDADLMELDGNIVAPGYFELMEIPRRAGRTFDAGDHERAPRVAVVSESLARRLWNTAEAAGRTLHFRNDSRTVIGVVADVPYRSPLDAPQPVVYLPLGQVTRERFIVHARVRNEREATVALARALRDVDPRVLVSAPRPLSQRLEEARTPAKIAQWVGSIAGVLQLALALMATWGLVAYAVERRMAELALRRALGATTTNILRLVMRPSLWLVAIAAIVGSVAGVLIAQAMHASFLGLAPIDLRVVPPAAGLVAAVVAVAAWWPARRAASIEPASALKHI